MEIGFYKVSIYIYTHIYTYTIDYIYVCIHIVLKYYGKVEIYNKFSVNFFKLSL